MEDELDYIYPSNQMTRSELLQLFKVQCYGKETKDCDIDIYQFERWLEKNQIYYCKEIVNNKISWKSTIVNISIDEYTKHIDQKNRPSPFMSNSQLIEIFTKKYPNITCNINKNFSETCPINCDHYKFYFKWLIYNKVYFNNEINEYPLLFYHKII